VQGTLSVLIRGVSTISIKRTKKKSQHAISQKKCMDQCEKAVKEEKEAKDKEDKEKEVKEKGKKVK